MGLQKFKPAKDKVVSKKNNETMKRNLVLKF
jgi:hypothetical protein